MPKQAPINAFYNMSSCFTSVSDDMFTRMRVCYANPSFSLRKNSVIRSMEGNSSQSVTDFFQSPDFQSILIGQSVTDQLLNGSSKSVQ